MNNIAILASGSGTTFDNLAILAKKGLVDFKINILITNKSSAGCVNMAEKHKIPFVVSPPEDVWNFIPKDTDLVVLAGWLKLLVVPPKWHRRVLNIHPSLLPKYGGKGFYGLNVHNAVIDNKEKESGCTIHLVDAKYDTGEIIEQQKIKVEDLETPESLQNRIQILEREVYPKIISDYLKNIINK